MPRNLAIYEAICALSSRMVSAAQEQDWDALVELEREVAGLRSSLAPVDDAALAADEVLRKRLLIQRILADDAEVRRHTEPWMEQVRRFLGAGATARRVESAYGAMR